MGEDQYIHIPHLDKSLEKFWPFTKVHSGLKRGRRSPQQQDVIPLEEGLLSSLAEKRKNTVFDGTMAGQAFLSTPSIFLVSHPRSPIASVLIALKLSAHLGELNRMFYRALGRLTINK